MYTRRDVLRLLAGACAIGTMTPDDLLAVSLDAHRALAMGPSSLGFFDAHQMHTVAAASDRIIPETDTPGAQVAEFAIRRIVEGEYRKIGGPEPVQRAEQLRQMRAESIVDGENHEEVCGAGCGVLEA